MKKKLLRFFVGKDTTQANGFWCGPAVIAD